MNKPYRMVVGVDFGLSGGLVCLDGNEVVLHSKMPVLKVPLIDGESTAKKERDSKSRSKEAMKHQRSKTTQELLPRVMTVYDTEGIWQFLHQAARVATSRAYLGLFVAIEEPQMFIGKSSPKSYFAAGRGQNAFMLACRRKCITPVWFSPKHWKSALGLTDDKELSLIWAKEHLQLPQDMSGDHDLCEAALLALFVQQHAERYLLR